MANTLRYTIISESAFTVQGHGVHTAFIEDWNSMAKLPNVKVTINAKGHADITHIHTVGPYSLRYLLFGSGKKVVSAHVVPESFVGSFIGARWWLPVARAYLRWFYNRADGVFAVSQEVVDELKTMGVKRPIYLVPNTIDTTQYTTSQAERESARHALGVNKDEFVVIANGQVQPRKRVDTFIACAKALPDMKFFWVGGMPFKKLAAEHKQMQKVIDAAPANVTFTGVIPHEEVMPYYRASDLFFLPSDQETFGIVIVEAAATGIPVLLRNNDQYHVTFKDWYESGDDDSFVDKIRTFATDKAYYTKWKNEAKNIANRYDSVAGAKYQCKIYNDILSKEKTE